MPFFSHGLQGARKEKEHGRLVDTAFCMHACRATETTHCSLVKPKSLLTVPRLRARLDSKFFWVSATVALSFVFGN